MLALCKGATMYYIVNNNNTVLFRSKNKASLENRLTKIKQRAFGNVAGIRLTNIKPVPAKSRLNVGLLSYNED